MSSVLGESLDEGGVDEVAARDGTCCDCCSSVVSEGTSGRVEKDTVDLATALVMELTRLLPPCPPVEVVMTVSNDGP